VRDGDAAAKPDEAEVGRISPPSTKGVPPRVDRNAAALEAVEAEERSMAEPRGARAEAKAARVHDARGLRRLR
jgi:hypothetical protein